MYEQLARLPLTVDGYRLEPRTLDAGAGWVRRTTVVVLTGLGVEGFGEDVNYQADDQLAFLERGSAMPLAGEFDLDGFSRHLDALETFPAPPREHGVRLYRRWALESAALDLALRQSRLSLAAVLGIEPRPMRFVCSLGLGSPPSLAPIHRRLRRSADLSFKVDYAADWTPALIGELAALGCVEIVDFKGQYRGVFRGPPGNADHYRLIAEQMPGSLLEDPEWTDATAEALDPFRDRVTWDAVLHSVADIEQCPFPPRRVNVKPSRFGFLSELFRSYEFCRGRGIAMYGGGQYELGPGRGQAQYLASLFHPEAPNDLAPAVYNETELPDRLPASPLALAVDPAGFRVAAESARTGD